MYILPEVVVYKDANFLNNTWRFNLPPGWGWSYVGDDWNDCISSVVVVSGTWQFFENAGFGGASTIVGPGYYKFVEDAQFNMQNDTISSIQCIDDQPQGDNPVIDL
jgi:Beta/Gamma crystallin